MAIQQFTLHIYERMRRNGESHTHTLIQGCSALQLHENVANFRAYLPTGNHKSTAQHYSQLQSNPDISNTEIIPMQQQQEYTNTPNQSEGHVESERSEVTPGRQVSPELDCWGGKRWE